jgi:urea transport system ATP-binding protein
MSFVRSIARRVTRRVASEFCILDKGRRVATVSIGELTDEVVRAHLSV